MSASDPHHMITIGASAGGTEKINLFFDHKVDEGVAYVIIHRLSTDFKSRMYQLLSCHSKVGVFEGENGTRVKCNEVYLIPNDKFIASRDSSIYLDDEEEVQHPHLTINKFFISDCGDKTLLLQLR